MMYKVIRFLCVFCLLTGFAQAEGVVEDWSKREKDITSVEWTTWNKVLFSSAVGGQAADVISSHNAFDRGCVEANPLYGGENVMLMSIVKIGMIGLTYWVVENYTEKKTRQVTRNIVYGIQGVMGAGIAVHNSTVDCY